MRRFCTVCLPDSLVLGIGRIVAAAGSPAQPEVGSGLGLTGIVLRDAAPGPQTADAQQAAGFQREIAIRSSRGVLPQIFDRLL